MEDSVATKCRHLAIISLQIRKLDAKVGNDFVVGGGVISVVVNANSFVENPESKVNTDNPFGIDISICLEGRKDKEDSVPQFSCLCESRGMFAPSDGQSIGEDEVESYVEMLSTQIYLPARQLMIDLMERMGVRVSLPLSVQLEKNKV